MMSNSKYEWNDSDVLQSEAKAILKKIKDGGETPFKFNSAGLDSVLFSVDFIGV